MQCLHDLRLPALQTQDVNKGVVILEKAVVLNELDALDLLLACMNKLLHQRVQLGVEDIELNVMVAIEEHKLL